MKTPFFLLSILLFFMVSCAQSKKETSKQNEELQLQKPKYMDQVTETVLKLNIEMERCYSDYIIEQELPYTQNEKLIVIPVFESLEDEYHFELNNHIAIINSKTGDIKSKYFENFKTNGWVSDAVKLSNIILDTVYYKVSENKTAFGIKTSFRGQSKANPYDYDMVTLYIKDNNTIKPILKNFIIFENKGEWDTECVGEFTTKDNKLVISQNKTNDYFDILVNQRTTISTMYKDENGDCDEKSEKKTKIFTLKYTNEKYK